MKLRSAAIFSGLTALAALLYSWFIMRLGLRIIGVPFPRQAWLLDQNIFWSLGIWLWLLAIFGWMLMLITLTWSYLPAHRIATMLQNGLVIIAAILSIAGAVIWMNTLPWAAAQDNAPQWLSLIDGVVLALVGAGLFMGGIVTVWLVVDLARLDFLRWAWVVPGILAGLAAIPSPFLLPRGLHLMLAAIIWCGWCFFLASRRRMPQAYAEWR